VEELLLGRSEKLELDHGSQDEARGREMAASQREGGKAARARRE
jgi:hypothetical protein